MSRLLQPNRRTAFLDGTNPQDGFVSRIAKFIPSETGSLFTIVNAYLLQSANEVSSDRGGGLSTVLFLNISLLWWSLFVLVACFLANIALLDRMFDKEFASSPSKKELKRKHIFASSVGFLIWSYSIRSPLFVDLYAPFLAVLLIGIFLILCWEIKPPEVD